MSGLPRSIWRINKALGRVRQTRYPAFIFGFGMPKSEIPAFIYHDVEHDDFAADLEFLQRNGYATLSTEEFVDYSKRGDGTKAVLLTFDDAGRNFWDVTFPLLKKYDARATVFAPTRWVEGPKAVIDPNFEKDSGLTKIMNWDHLRTIRDSGHVDVQSHAHRHALVFVSSNLVGFASPGDLKQYSLNDWPMRQNGEMEIQGRPPLGTPIYEAEPLLSATSRVLENPTVVEACQQHVTDNGGEDFFRQNDWGVRLRSVYENATSSLGCPVVVPAEELKSLAQSEFEYSNAMFEQEMGHSPRYFAYPWMLGTKQASEMSVQAGMQADFGVGLDFKRARHGQGPNLEFGRFKGDWLRFLPGKGRSKLSGVLPGKLKGLIAGQHLAQ